MQKIMEMTKLFLIVCKIFFISGAALWSANKSETKVNNTASTITLILLKETNTSQSTEVVTSKSLLTSSKTIQNFSETIAANASPTTMSIKITNISQPTELHTATKIVSSKGSHTSQPTEQSTTNVNSSNIVSLKRSDSSQPTEQSTTSVISANKKFMSAQPTELPTATTIVSSKGSGSSTSIEHFTTTAISSNSKFTSESPDVTKSISNVVLENVGCSPHETVVKTHEGHPYYIKLDRCQGGESAIKNKRCTMTEFEMLSYWESSIEDYVEIAKHIKCDFKCINISCINYQIWNNDTCTCDCPTNKPQCPPGYQWNTNDCNCVDESTAKSNVEQCQDMMDVKFVYVLGFTELVVVTVTCFAIFNYFCKNGHGKSPIGSQELPLNKLNSKSDTDYLN